MNYIKYINFIKMLPRDLNSFYLKELKKKIKVSNKSTSKNVYDPVTNLDKAFEKYIRYLINMKFPNDSIEGEEFKNKNKFNEYKWTIDPIDGTKAFIIGVPTWSNLIGLSFKKKSLLGLANFPELQKFYFNDINRGYVFEKNKKKILRSSRFKKNKDIKIIGNLRNLTTKLKMKILKKLGNSFRTTNLDAYAYCLLAEGKVDAVVESSLKTFDIIPLIPIIKKAGGIVTTWKNSPAEKAGNILATSNQKLHKKLLRLIDIKK